MTPRRVLFSGYARVHFVCFLPVYEVLARDPRLEVFLSGGFKSGVADAASFSIRGFYDEFPVDRARIIDPEQAKREDFDVVVCAHLSDTLFPRSFQRSVQIFHGVSFKNLAVREKALRYDFLCLPGRYHAEQYLKQGLVRPDASTVLITGFPKLDRLVDSQPGPEVLLRALGLDPSQPTVLFAPTGDKHNALEVMGREVISELRRSGGWNVLVKPHDHPKREIDWFWELADLEGGAVRLIRDPDVVPYLRAAAVLLTDASSVALEYTALDRPILFLATPRLLERLRERAPALDLDTYGQKLGEVVESPSALVAALERALADPRRGSALRRQAAAHLFHAPGRATDHVAAVVRRAAGIESALPAQIEPVLPV
jgi:hypothetical protein